MIEAGIEDWVKRDVPTGKESQEISEIDLHAFVDLRYERCIEASTELARKQDSLHSRPTAGYRKPKQGDLVLIRDFQQVKDKGRRFEPRWSTLRIVERISASGVSAHVRHLYNTPEYTKRFHIDHLILHVPRTNDYPSEARETPGYRSGGVEYLRGTMGHAVGVGSVGQRGFDITDVDSLAGP